jgi:hypothetical protein
MPTLLARTVREVFRRELIPTRLRWWFAAEGMADWFSVLREELGPHVPAIDETLADVARPMFERRYSILRASFPSLPDAPRAVGLTMGALYRIASYPDARWIFEPLGGAPSSFGDHIRAERLIAPIPLDTRWSELTCHLGELLIAVTERMPLPRVRPILGDICFAAGERFARRMKRAFAMNDAPDNALELLRMSEYVFRVNPQHWGESDATTGWLEGTACPWYDAPGWNGAHCGIFGQFQSGIASAFGLRYHLTSTIPKNGGHICRIDVKPIQLTAKPRTAA